MSQAEIIEILEANKGRKFTSSQLAKLLKINSSTVTTSLKSLRKTDHVFWERKRNITGENSHWIYYYWI